MGNLVDSNSGFHGREERGLLLSGPCCKVLLEHGQLQWCHGVPGWAQVKRQTHFKKFCSALLGKELPFLLQVSESAEDVAIYGPD